MHRLCRPQCTTDVRAAWLARLVSAPCDRLAALLWPRLLPLHHIVEDPPPLDDPAAPLRCVEGFLLKLNHRDAPCTAASDPDGPTLRLG